VISGVIFAFSALAYESMELHDRPSGFADFLEMAPRELPELPPPDVDDPVINAYKKDVDRTLLIENLRLTPDQRSQKFQRFMEIVYAVRHAGERMRASS
jgi:hypothetical protein